MGADAVEFEVLHVVVLHHLGAAAHKGVKVFLVDVYKRQVWGLNARSMATTVACSGYLVPSFSVISSLLPD